MGIPPNLYSTRAKGTEEMGNEQGQGDKGTTDNGKRGIRRRTQDNGTKPKKGGKGQRNGKYKSLQETREGGSDKDEETRHKTQGAKAREGKKGHGT
jgi:hypothetical protein